ncbi:Ti-type conjugative transfer relaxase TraA [Serratia marcescens]|uniref:Ti-type conjugative transfer relaxase TraA n=1 Tax=Serratia marcescens TaxID=615 RepID=UPI001F14D3A4|nr:Ti-type conjugative transfer relaxase TraA [Serratia marcescens]
MAIYHCSVKAVSRSTGRSAPGAAAYRAGELLTDNRTGEVFDYTKKGGVMSADIVLPDGAPEWAKDRNQLWNAAEAAERRKDACVAREYEVALPHELTHEQRRELALTFAKELSERHGVAVDVCLHEPSRDGNDKNYHAHILTTTRVMGKDGLEGKAEIEKAGRKRTDDLKETRALWGALCNDALERAGHVERVDHRSYKEQGVDLTPTKHIGVSAVAMDRKGMDAERLEIHAETRAENAEKIEANPSLILDKITTTQAVFDRRDMARELNRYIDDPQQFQNIMARLESAPELVQLAPEMTDGRRTVPAKFTTREMVMTERAMIDSAERLAGAEAHGVSADTIARTVDRYDTLSDEQRAAVEHVTGEGRLSVIIGDAGTGKSFAMRVAKEAWEAEGFRVRGCALAGKAADELQAGSGIDSRTIHSLEASWNRGVDMLTARDVLVIDEAGMVGSRQLGRVLEAAEKAGAKVVMLGDDKQLAAIEAGAGFRAITERVGAAEITQIRRQTESWAREASTELARGDVRTGLDAYHERGHVRIEDTREEARTALATDWLADREKGGTSIILAHTNKDVASLNATVRTALKASGELGAETEFLTERGARSFSEGDRLVFLKNDSALGVKNGTLGTVEKAEDGRLSVRLDSGREVDFDAGTYGHVDHGYAVTIHKSQGVTVDRAYVLATGGMDRNLAYVGMTRHRDSATLYAGAEDFTDRRSGRLVAHGAAPYENNPENSQSYFVTLESDSGKQRTIWGVDLARAVAESGAQLGDRIGLEHTGSETVQLPDGGIAERNHWQVNGSAELAYAKLAERLGRQQPKASTLDFAESAYGFAEQRDFDGAGVVRQWVERGREKLAGLADRAEKALSRVLERAGIRRDVPGMEQATPEAIAALREPQTQPEPTPEDAARAAAIAEVERAFGGGQPVRQVDPLDVYRKGVEQARQAGDGLDIQIAERRLQLAEDAQAAGHNPAHMAAKINAQAQADVIAGLQDQQPQTRPEPTPEDAARAAARAEVERAFGGGKVERPASQQQEPGMSERDKARAEVEKAMGHGRKRDRGIEL